MAKEAVTVAKQQKEQQETGGLRTFASGVRGRLVPVSQSLIQDALAHVREPPVPMWYNADKEREEPNPADPAYLRAREQYRADLNRVVFDMFAMFGIELEDGLPEDDAWLRRLLLMERRGNLDLSPFDTGDEVDREFLYKRFVALTNDEIMEVGLVSGITPQEVRRAADSFRGEEARGADSGSPDEG